MFASPPPLMKNAFGQRTSQKEPTTPQREAKRIKEETQSPAAPSQEYKDQYQGFVPEGTFISLAHSARDFVVSFRKILVSVKLVSAILGPEMAASILWTPGKMRSFCRKTHVHKIPRFRGWGILGFGGGGGSADFIFMGARIFLIHLASNSRKHSLAL